MAEKSGTVVKCTFTKEWTNPKGAIVYYHLLIMDNGDVGSVGTMEKNPAKIKEGTKITYEIKDDKIKLVSDSNYTPAGKSKGGGTFRSREKTNEEYLGYAWSYAKDLIIAGKKLKDFKELKDLARAIYGEIKLIREEEKNGGNEEKPEQMRIYLSPIKAKRNKKREKRIEAAIKNNVAEPSYHVSPSGEKIKYIRDNN